MLNVCVLVGRLGKEPELRYTTGGKAVCTLRLGVDRGTTDAAGKKETDWVDAIVWEKQAETCANYLQKGRLIGVQGRLQIRQYETAEGQKREKAEVVANTVRFLDRGTDAPSGGKPSMGSEPNFDDESVPF
jgi:single-strand DNA-binding protein